MTTEVSVDLDSLPGRTREGGYVYAIAFDNDTVKVGSSANPAERIRIHQISAEQFGLVLTDVWVSPPLETFRVAERRLLAAAAGMSASSHRAEWFRGVDFHALVAVAPHILHAPDQDVEPIVLTPADHWARVKQVLGARSNREAARRVGIPLGTAERMFREPERTTMRNALKMRAATGISLDDLFPPAEKQAA